MKKTLEQLFVFILSLSVSFICICLFNSFSCTNFNSIPLEDDIELQPSAPDYWPTLGWRTSLPKDQGVAITKLREMEVYIDNKNIKQNIDSLLIIRNGYLVYEKYPSTYYDENDRHHIYSCTKVFISALIGIAIEEGYITGVDDYVLDYFPNKTIAHLDSQKEAIKIQHLLTMSSGLSWNDQVNYYQMGETSDWVKYVLDRPMDHEPGTVWNYNSGGSHVLSAILNQVTPNGTLAYAKAKIFDFLNINNYLWYTDNQGIPNGATLLHLIPRDMAKFGFLYLNNGYWNSNLLIPFNWIAESSRSFMDVEFDQGEGSGYGYQWWIYRWANAFTARGSYEQYIVVIPDLNLVVVSTGNTDFHFIRLLVDFILPSVGFYPLNLVTMIISIISLSTISLFLGFMLNRIGKRRSLREVKEEYYTAIKEENI